MIPQGTEERRSSRWEPAFCGSSRGRDMAEAVNGEPEAVGGGAWQRRRGIHRPGKAEKGRKSEIQQEE